MIILILEHISAFSFTEYSKMFNEILFSLYCYMLYSKSFFLGRLHCYLEEEKNFMKIIVNNDKHFTCGYYTHICTCMYGINVGAYTYTVKEKTIPHSLFNILRNVTLLFYFFFFFVFFFCLHVF